MQKFIQTYIIFKERVILQIVKLFFHNNLTDSDIPLEYLIKITITFINIKEISITLVYNSVIN